MQQFNLNRQASRSYESDSSLIITQAQVVGLINSDKTFSATGCNK